MNFVSCLLCVAIRVLDLVIRAFDAICIRVIKIYDTGDHRQSATVTVPQYPSKTNNNNNGKAFSSSSGAFGQYDLRKWLLRLLGGLLFLAYVWAMIQDDENQGLGSAQAGDKRKQKKKLTRLAFANLKM